MKPKQLSSLEHEIMNIVWELKQCSVRDVLENLNKNRKLAYTTVATVLQRLHDKGLVVRKGQGVTFLYSPKRTKQSYSKDIAKSFINTFFSSFGDVAVASFAESIDSLPKKKRDYLLELLEEYDKAK